MSDNKHPPRRSKRLGFLEADELTFHPTKDLDHVVAALIEGEDTGESASPPAPSQMRRHDGHDPASSRPHGPRRAPND